MFEQDAPQFAGGAWGLGVLAVGQGDGAGEAGRGEGGGSQGGAAAGDHAGDDGEAEAGFDEAEDGVHFAAFDGEGGFEAGGAAGGDGEFAQVVAAPEHHQGAVAEVLDAQLRGCVGGGDGDEVLVEERGGVQGGVVAVEGQHNEGEVEAACGELAYEVAGAAFFDDELDAGVLAVVGGEDVGEESGAEAGGGAEADAASAELDEFLDFQGGGLGVGDDARGGVSEGDCAAVDRGYEP